MTIETDTFLSWLETICPGHDADTILDVCKGLADIDVVPSYEHTLQALHDRHADFDELAEADHWDQGEYIRLQREQRALLIQAEAKAAQRMNEVGRDV